MAFFSKHFILLTLAVLISSLQIEARNTLFFNKVARGDNDQITKTTETKAPEDAPFAYPPQSELQNGYGLYGHKSDQNPSLTTAEYTTTNTNIPSTYTTEEFANGESLASKEKEEESTTTYRNNNNNYQNKQFGIGDTRFRDNSRYYYNNDNYRNGYESVNGYGSSKEVDSGTRYDNGVFYPDNESTYGYNTSLDGLPSRQGENVEDEFLP